MLTEDPAVVIEPAKNTLAEKEYRLLLEAYGKESQGSFNEKMRNFSKFVPRQVLASFLARYEIFKRVLGLQGSVVECGVFQGAGLFTFAQLSAILEPYNHQRRVIGFDTFEGFPELSPEDTTNASVHAVKGGMKADSYDDIIRAVRLFDRNRPLGHIPKIELVRGDITKTAPEYIEKNPHLVVNLLYLDVDIFEPTKAAIECFIPRMPKGAVIGFDEVNAPAWPGETLALLTTLGIRGLHLERCIFEPNICYAVLD